MDEALKQKLADLAHYIVAETGGSEGRAIALAEKAGFKLMELVREVIDTIPSNKDRLS